MSTPNIEILAILRHYWKKKVNASEATRIICEIEGDDVLKIRTAQNWYQKFNSGDTSLEVKHRCGRPKSFESFDLRRSIESNPQQSTRSLSKNLGMSQSTVVRQLHSMGKRVKKLRQVPHNLTNSQKNRRIEICKILLQNPLDKRFLKRIVTSDEKWIYFSNPNNAHVWLDDTEEPQMTVKRKPFDKKVMISVWWNYEGVIHFELIPEGQTINSDLFCEQLNRLDEIMLAKYPALVNRKKVLLQYDNAKPHTSVKTKEKIIEMENYEVLPHPAYSPDLAPSDYHLFRSMAHFLQGREFTSSDDVKRAMHNFFESKNKEWYEKGILDLASRWVKVIENNGIYFKV